MFLIEVKNYSEKSGLEFLCTPFDLNSAEFLASLNVNAYKIASADLTNLELLEYVADKHKPMLISTGMSYWSEIEKAVQLLQQKEVDDRRPTIHITDSGRPVMLEHDPLPAAVMMSPPLAKRLELTTIERGGALLRAHTGSITNIRSMIGVPQPHWRHLYQPLPCSGRRWKARDSGSS